MTIELKEETRPRSRMEISPEVFAQITENLKAALTDLTALRGSIPCFLSAPASLAVRMEKHLALIQGAVGSIDVVREDRAVCALCLEPFFGFGPAGLCPACARDRGVTA